MEKGGGGAAQGQRDTIVAHLVTFVILPPLKFANRFRDRVRTFEERCIVNLFEAGTIFLHLKQNQKDNQFRVVVALCVVRFLKLKLTEIM